MPHKHKEAYNDDEEIKITIIRGTMPKSKEGRDADEPPLATPFQDMSFFEQVQYISDLKFYSRRPHSKHKLSELLDNFGLTMEKQVQVLILEAVMLSNCTSLLPKLIKMQKSNLVNGYLEEECEELLDDAIRNLEQQKKLHQRKNSWFAS